MQLETKNAPRLETDNFRFINTSEAVQSIDYSRRLKILEVEFINGGVYHYLNVSRETWKELQETIESGESLGAYVNSTIKANHDYYKLEVPGIGELRNRSIE
jgi:hypothetical protein